jgi:hypothetical protein
VQDDGGAEAFGQLHHAIVVQIGAQLRQVGAVERTRVQVDQPAAVADHLIEQRVGDA